MGQQPRRQAKRNSMLNDDPHAQISNQSHHPRALPGPLGAPATAPGQYMAADDGVDLSQIWGIVRENSKLVLAVASIVFVAVMARCLNSHMMFRSVARMYMGESDHNAQNSNGIEISSGSGEADSEIEVLRSRAMVRKGVLGSGLNVSIDPPNWQPPRYWQWLLSRRNALLLDTTADIVTATNSSLAPHVLDPRQYQITFNSPRQYTLDGAGEPVHGEIDRPLELADATLTLTSGRIGPVKGNRFDVTIYPVEDTVAHALQHLSVSVPKGKSDPARVLLLEFVSPSRRQAASFLEHLMRGYMAARLEWKTEDASAAEAFVTDQLRSLRASLDRSLTQLAEFRADNSVVITGNQALAAAQQVNQYEERRINARLELSALKRIQSALKDPALPVEAYMVGEQNDAVLQRMAASLADSRDKLSALEASFSENAPDVKQQRALVASQLTAIRHYVNGRASRAEEQLGALNRVIAHSEQRLKTVPGAELTLAQMSREADVYTRLYNDLLERKQQAAIAKASTVSKNRILDHAYVPLYEDSPKLTLHLASGILGLLLGAAYVILRGLFSAVFRRESDVKSVLGSLQVVARIPIRARHRSEDAQAGAPVFDVLGGHQDTAYTEAFRALRTNLYRALPGEHGKVLMVTSAYTEDGKTTCALSLAAMLAADNRNVLVIDADVRNPSHHRHFGIPKAPGLSEVVQQDHRYWKDATRTLALSSGTFDALTAGESPRAELLSDPQFSALLITARSHYDFIILDSPSYPAVSDPLIAAPLCDFVLSVVRLGSTSRKLAEEHLAEIFSVSRGHGVAVNSVEAAYQNLRPQSMVPKFAGAFRRLR